MRMTRSWSVVPSLIADLRSCVDALAANPEGLVPQVVQALKKNFPELGVMTDVALDPYTSHGQDGLIDDQGRIPGDNP